MIIHSTRLKQQKSYDILRFMRNPTIFNDTIGFGSSHQHIFSTLADRGKEGGGGAGPPQLSALVWQPCAQFAQTAHGHY